MGSGDGSAVKTTGYSSQGLGFYPQCPHAGSKYTVMPPLTAIVIPGTHIVCGHPCRQNINALNSHQIEKQTNKQTNFMNRLEEEVTDPHWGFNTGA